MSGRSVSKWLGLAAATLLVATAAHAGEWRVVQKNGEVWLGSDTAQPVSLGSTDTLPEGATLITGTTGRAMLVHDGQTMLVGPNSVAVVPKDDEPGLVTVIQRAGEIEFDVDKQKVPHFAVETPYLAAVVKGTHFIVKVDYEGAAVDVDHGLVGVSDLVTGQRVDTATGQTAKVTGPNQTLSIGGSGQLALILPGPPRAPRAAPLSRVELRTIQNDAAKGIFGPSVAPGNGGIEAAGGVAAAIGAGGNDDGGSGGSGSGGVTVALNGSGGAGIPTYSTGGNSSSRYDAAEPTSLAPVVLAVAFACAVMLAFGLAFLRGRFG